MTTIEFVWSFGGNGKIVVHEKGNPEHVHAVVDYDDTGETGCAEPAILEAETIIEELRTKSERETMTIIDLTENDANAKVILSTGKAFVVFGLDKEKDETLFAQGFRFGICEESHPDTTLAAGKSFEKTSDHAYAVAGKNNWTLSRTRPVKRRVPELVSDIDIRIAALEKLTASPVPGTQIVRVAGDDPSGPAQRWCIAVGGLSMPKEFFHGDTIEDALSEAEKTIGERIASGNKPVRTEMDKLNETFALQP